MTDKDKTNIFHILGIVIGWGAGPFLCIVAAIMALVGPKLGIYVPYNIIAMAILVIAGIACMIIGYFTKKLGVIKDGKKT